MVKISRLERWRFAGWLGGVLAAEWEACAAVLFPADVEGLAVRRRDAAGPAGEDASAPFRNAIIGAFLFMLVVTSAHAETFKFFGSAGAEWQLTPANAASTLNPRNIAGLPYRSGSGDAVAFFDAAPDSRVWKFHVKLRGDAAEGGAQRADAGEAFVQLNPKPWLDITIGRVIEKWGTGYAWNPTAFVSPKKNPADPSDRRSANVGVDMIRTDLFIRGTNVSLYALNDGAVAGRVYRLIAGTDVSLHFHRDGDGTKQGISAARVFGDALELHGEIARRHALIGGQYTFRGNVNLVAELYHGGDGLDENAFHAFQSAADFAHDAKSFRAVNAAYSPLRMARTYGFIRVDIPHDKLDLELIAISNLRDGSLLVRATLSLRVRPNVSIYAIDTEFAGARGSELSYMQVRRVTTAGARYYF
ncbi:MAG: hypothetical protein JO093_14345 [Acidobacteria bacterium]|nr:hypothetical protein [Acidobacteriota bacterium]MBV9069596.1 hypothetical protein [Acidobacteriota bacterium]MBV9186797.1 hypothetical protein [Acidobacteriota bacterium]